MTEYKFSNFGLLIKVPLLLKKDFFITPS